jgi:diguanylate cyclase (GGDEF)-like protein
MSTLLDTFHVGKRRQEGSGFKRDLINIRKNSFNDFSREKLLCLVELQNCLNINKLLHTIFTSLQRHFSLTYLSLSCPKSKFNYQQGEQTTFQKLFLLRFENKMIAHITLCFQTNLTSNHIEALREWMRCFIFPLKNALSMETLRQTGLTDPLTGTANRLAFANLFHEQEELNQQITTLAVLVIDIDRFKKINDSYGHLVGDAILKLVSRSIIKNVRKSDHVYRIGGEEFFVTLENLTMNEAASFAERIRKAITKLTYPHNHEVIKLTVSIGMTWSDDHAHLNVEMSLKNKSHIHENFFI